MKILTLTSTLAISVSALSSGLALTSTLAIYVSALSSGLEKNESLSRLEELTVLCSGFSLGKDDCDHYNELIRVVNKHTAVTNLKLTRDFKEFVANTQHPRQSHHCH